MSTLEKLDIVISIYNQEKIIRRVLEGIFQHTYTPFNLILIFDGCTDNSQKIAFEYLNGLKSNRRFFQKLIYRVTPNLYETKANNVGFRLSREKFLITVQDDMVIHEDAWEQRLTYPLRKYDDILAVTARGAQDFVPGEGKIERYTDTADHSQGLPREIFAIRDVINRGPVALRMDFLRRLNFLNESYAPCNLDDAELCLRAWRKYRWRCGVFWINYESRLAWGKVRAKDSSMPVSNSNAKNLAKIYKTYGKYINSGIKHSEDIILSDKEIQQSFELGKYLSFERKLINKFTIVVLNLKSSFQEKIRIIKAKPQRLYWLFALESGVPHFLTKGKIFTGILRQFRSSLLTPPELITWMNQSHRVLLKKRRIKMGRVNTAKNTQQIFLLGNATVLPSSLVNNKNLIHNKVPDGKIIYKLIWLLTYLRENKPDYILVGQITDPLLLFLLARFYLDRRVALTTGCSGVIPTPGRIWFRILREKLWQRLDCVFVDSVANATRLYDLGLSLDTKLVALSLRN